MSYKKNTIAKVISEIEQKKMFLPALQRLDSTSKCNTLPKDLCWGGKSKTLSWSVVEPTLDGFDIFAL